MTLVKFLLTRILEDLTVASAEAELDHLWRFQLSRVRAEVESKRHIISKYEQFYRPYGPEEEPQPGEPDYTVRCVIFGILKLMALPYAEHADYNPAWRP